MWNSFLLYTPTYTEYFVTSLSFGLSSFYHHDYILVTFSFQQFRWQLQLTPWSSMLWYCKQIPVQLKYLNQPRRTTTRINPTQTVTYWLANQLSEGKKRDIGLLRFRIQVSHLGVCYWKWAVLKRKGGKKKGGGSFGSTTARKAAGSHIA